MQDKLNTSRALFSVIFVVGETSSIWQTTVKSAEEAFNNWLNQLEPIDGLISVEDISTLRADIGFLELVSMNGVKSVWGTTDTLPGGFAQIYIVATMTENPQWQVL